ncbi:hypothetical protein [Streptomyces kanamyceticus]|uniref:Uncharacterized protein n=1 Tax=Streptomyces kanamyceticus TaxID=1967 RepID=Q1EQN7_STRKN|nr:hypothetical protein [Streptomyces kanamyceticus]QEU90522.1 hypothetical protein CP970_05995 [Streptomyces kanamyceticus]BAE95483.1 hypothetical protein [Streptomyces kanamyceticus]
MTLSTQACTELMIRPYTVEDTVAGRLLVGLRRSKARDGVDADALYDDLNTVLDEQHRPTSAEISRLADRFRQVTLVLIELVPLTVTPYPVDAMQLLIELRANQPCPQRSHRHILRFALAIVDVLNLMGDDAP